jgi:hypothetical protein
VDWVIISTSRERRKKMNRSTINIDTEDLDNFFMTLDNEYFKQSATWRDFVGFVKVAIEEIESENKKDED